MSYAPMRTRFSTWLRKRWLVFAIVVVPLLSVWFFNWCIGLAAARAERDQDLIGEIRMSHVDDVRRLLDQGADPNARDTIPKRKLTYFDRIMDLLHVSHRPHPNLGRSAILL